MTQAQFNASIQRELNGVRKSVKSLGDRTQAVESGLTASAVQMKITGIAEIDILGNGIMTFNQLTFKTPDIVVESSTNTAGQFDTIVLPRTGVYRLDLVMQAEVTETIIFPLINGVQDHRMTFFSGTGGGSSYVLFRTVKPNTTLMLQSGAQIQLSPAGSIDLANLIVQYIGDNQLLSPQ